MSDPYRIEQTREQDTLRLAWDNRLAPKQRGLFIVLIVFWLMWARATLYMTGLILRGQVTVGFMFLWTALGWLATLAVPIGVLSRRWTEWVIVTPTSITYGGKGILAPKPRTYPISPDRPDIQLAFGFFSSGIPIGGENDPETVETLSLFGRNRWGFRKRIVLGYWLAPEVKLQIFIAIRDFVSAHQIPLNLQRNDSPQSSPR